MAEMTDTRERLRRFPDPCHVAYPQSRLPHQRRPPPRPRGRDAGVALTTTGRGSGRPRTATLTYFRDGSDLVVIGSFGGSDLVPAWWLNLQCDPRASVLIGGRPRG
jgi:F420H(2)-dependent quinone reductase